MRVLIIGASLALSLAGCAEVTGPVMNGLLNAPTAADTTPTAGLSFVAVAGASDLYEIQSSQIALQKAQSQAVRSFAQMMINHHTQTTQQVTAAAAAAGLAPPPPQLTPMQAQMISELQTASGTAFDAAYLRQQREAHQMALSLHSTYAKSGDTPTLRAAAAAATPIVQQHITMLQQLPS